MYLVELLCHQWTVPFQKVDEILKEIKNQCDIILVDIHAEATSEKIAMGFYLDGKVTCVVGTHTHVQTADNRILPKEQLISVI